MRHDDELVRIGEALRVLGVSRGTLWAWERRGFVDPYRDHRGHRFYSRAQIRALQELMTPRQRVAK